MIRKLQRLAVTVPVAIAMLYFTDRRRQKTSMSKPIPDQRSDSFSAVAGLGALPM